MDGQLDELDEKEREQRKHDQIEYRNKRKNSNMFLFVGTICEVLICFLTVLLLFLLSAIIVYRVLGGFTDDVKTIIFNILLVITFIGGLAGGFFIYRAIGRFVIKKMDLKDKLNEEVLNQFKSRKEFKADYEKKQQR